MPSWAQGATLPNAITESALEDEALLVRARRDPDTFALIYETYFDAVYRYCYHRLGDWSAAEDATSAVFTNAYAAFPRYQGDAASSFRSWLFAIAHNVVANHQSRTDRGGAPSDGAGGSGGGWSSTGSGMSRRSTYPKGASTWSWRTR